MSPEPYPKSKQLARGERRYWRTVASPKQWQALIEAKGGPCRICGMRQSIQLHHLVPRAQGGDDTADNLVPLCAICHVGVTSKVTGTALRLVTALTDSEYAYAVEKAGEAVWERLYGIRYER